MPLLHFTPNNTFYSAACSFMYRESEEDFYWAIDQFKYLIRFDLQPPKCFITDDDKGMRKALSQVFDVPQVLCSWHIQQNVLHRVELTWRLADYVEGSDVTGRTRGDMLRLLSRNFNFNFQVWYTLRLLVCFQSPFPKLGICCML